MRRVLNREPWVFDNHLLSLKPFDGITPPQKIDFSTKDFWVQFHNLPLGCMNPKMGKNIANTVGSFKDCEIQEDGLSWGSVLQALIEMNIQQPIARGRTINVQGNRHWIPFTYEKLPRLCFKCGRISHGNGHCDFNETQNKSPTGPLGPWLRAGGNRLVGRGKPFTGSPPSFSGDTPGSSESRSTTNSTP